MRELKPGDRIAAYGPCLNDRSVGTVTQIEKHMIYFSRDDNRGLGAVHRRLCVPLKKRREMWVLILTDCSGVFTAYDHQVAGSTKFVEAKKK